jgi:hypothetical protein
MAKCIKHKPSGAIARVNDATAHSTVSANPVEFCYVPKSEFKRYTRETIKPIPLGSGPSPK